jgi:DNA-binding response OmpR family regulator
MSSWSSLALCRELRTRVPDIGILFLTPRHALDDKLEAFRAGADDYVIRPFEPDELVARVRALMRRRMRFRRVRLAAFLSGRMATLVP